MYLPLHNESRRHYLFRISVSKLGFFTVSLPLFAFIICVLVTIHKDFENANKTHCKVPNFLPSISASIGSFEPQRTIWQAAIYIHLLPRLFIIYSRWKYYINVIYEDYSGLVNLSVLLNVFENLALLGLTFWTSAYYYPYHEFCFKTFIGTSIFYMLFINILLTKCKRRKNVTNTEKRSIKFKWRAFFLYVVSFACAAYFFLRHNRFCEPYVYSMFGFSEYIVIVSNIGFHLTTLYDLPRQYLTLTKYGFILE